MKYLNDTVFIMDVEWFIEHVTFMSYGYGMPRQKIIKIKLASV